MCPLSWEGGAVSWKWGLNRAQTNNLPLPCIHPRSAVPAQLLQAQADKLKLQGELEVAERALESSRKESTELQGKLDLAQYTRTPKLTIVRSETSKFLKHPIYKASTRIIELTRSIFMN
jgi:hypothetical protein